MTRKHSVEVTAITKLLARAHMAPGSSCHVAYPKAIPESNALAEASSYGQTIVEYDPLGRGTEAYRTLAKEFLERHLIKTTA